MMIPEWKLRQEIYHRINTEHSDDLNDKEIVITDNVVDDAVRYFYETDIGWIYPAKSYMVGICYAKWLSQEFGGELLEHLNDPELLYGNDPHFKPYEESKHEYDAILSKVGEFGMTGMVPDVYEYFREEFMLNS